MREHVSSLLDLEFDEGQLIQVAAICMQGNIVIDLLDKEFTCSNDGSSCREHDLTLIIGTYTSRVPIDYQIIQPSFPKSLLEFADFVPPKRMVEEGLIIISQSHLVRT